MKNLFTLLVITVLTISCSGDDNPNSNLNGKWNMVSYVAFMPSIPELNEGDIVWTFSENRLVIENNVEEQYPYLLTSGSYTIEYDTEHLYLEGIEWDYEINNNELTIIDLWDSQDGPNIRFDKIN